MTPEVVREHNLNQFEYEKILGLLGRAPTLTELGVFSALWSEHCSYKHSKPILKKFPTTGPAVVQGPGENAGVLRLKDGWAVAFKIESHNHPSAVEPYQGAATGVGGILRDVFTMGARPVAMLNSLRFGSLDTARNRYLFAGVVRGVGDYGNCVGIPTLGGEVNFAEGYTGNPLVNAMCVGLLREDQLITARAHGVGNVLLVRRRPHRARRHPRGELRVRGTHARRARRAGPRCRSAIPSARSCCSRRASSSSTAATSSRSRTWAPPASPVRRPRWRRAAALACEIDTALVPTREPGMTPYEILLSESQERMLVVAEPGRVAEVQAVCARWELGATPIGHVTDDGVFRVTHDGLTVVAIPGPAPGR